MVSSIRLATLSLCLAAIAVTSAGCATSTDDADDVQTVESTGATTEALTIDLNCGKSIPGMPPLPCKPNLKFSGQLVTEVWKPGNPQNMAPGRYIHFGYFNDSDKPAGAFTVNIVNQNGGVEQSVNVPGLAPHTGAQLIEPAPYACGWSRTMTLDTGNTVDESSENDNVFNVDYFCTRVPVMPSGPVVPVLP